MPRNRRDEAIAAPRYGFNKARVFGRIAQDFPQPHHGVVQSVIKINERVAGPQPAAQFVSCDNLTRVFEKDGEDLKRLFRELEPNAMLADFASL